VPTAHCSPRLLKCKLARRWGGPQEKGERKGVGFVSCSSLWIVVRVLAAEEGGEEMSSLADWFRNGYVFGCIEKLGENR